MERRGWDELHIRSPLLEMAVIMIRKILIIRIVEITIHLFNAVINKGFVVRTEK